MNPSLTDLEAPFWQQIQEHPADALPRLLHADWCDEHDRPLMGTVQRWLAATNRLPHFSGGAWWWSIEQGWHDAPDSARLPPQLFQFLPFRRESDRVGDPVVAIRYPTLRAALEAVATAWSPATSKRWLRRPWQPNLHEVKSTVIPRARRSRPPETPERVWGWENILLLLVLIPIAAGFILQIAPSAPVEREPPVAKKRPLPGETPFVRTRLGGQ